MSLVCENIHHFNQLNNTKLITDVLVVCPVYIDLKLISKSSNGIKWYNKNVVAAVKNWIPFANSSSAMSCHKKPRKN